ncbi:glycosyltransferase-like domain-containing protein 1 isoform X2 [Uloborus diversus]|uniref:glycosyltransferase-like domain-containing protein 1 isoform X2 n=1 Tax=Uloborus diversus TaxID=327109 RepID=UPI002409732B|nr:glycosyltransferase-like domain-containing protein 1 isoform X2 [Uloborus diversus]
MMNAKSILLIEAFYGGSHKQLMDLISTILPVSFYTMPAKKWHWRAITSSLHFSEAIPEEHDFRVLFASSVLPLADLVALRPDLGNLFKIVYFHENQVVYPVQEKKQRYFQHGYNDVLTCLVADQILFNSDFNKESFLKNLTSYFNILPDFKPKNLEAKIRPKCQVVYFPLVFPEVCSAFSKDGLNQHSSKAGVVLNNHQPRDGDCTADKKLHIVWPHRWEHDKDPETFFSVIFRLKAAGEEFNLSVIGETFSENPKIFDEARIYLKENIITWGYQESKEEYFKVLQSADVVVSTAIHEFFGVSMLEAVSCGCYPLCPNRLAYPEIYPGGFIQVLLELYEDTI